MKPGLERIDALLDALGRPDRGLRGALVAGTNGKGSTGAVLVSILRAAGLRTGFMPKPHLLSAGERIQVDGRPLALADLAAAREALQPVLDALGGTEVGAPSEFEVVTALAVDLLAPQVDRLVCEVGLGGLLDATNVLDLGVAVVTNVDLDHQEHLGPTIADIAVHKAGIVKPGNTVVTAATGEAAGIVATRAGAVGATLWRAGHEIEVRATPQGWDGHRLDVRGPGFAHEGLVLRLLGDHQVANAALAVAAAHAGEGDLPPAVVAEGVAATRWPGRMEVVAERPRVVVDAAHNPAGLLAVGASLRRLVGDAPVDVVLGTLDLRDPAEMAAALRTLAPRSVTCTRPTGTDGHATAPEVLAAAYGPGAEVREAPADALAAAVDRAGPDGTVLACGTLALVADVLRLTGHD
jgi:dihydrofolate synthase/folylpolyglutamate synthase